MPNQFAEVTWDEATIKSALYLIRQALQEDFGDRDWTTLSTVGKFSTNRSVGFVAREPIRVCGVQLLECVVTETGAQADLRVLVEDGSDVSPGECIATLSGSADEILTMERTMLNFLGNLSGVASHTKRFCELVAGTKAEIYDTRKTLPGFRRLHKYAVRCGGGRNHRSGLHDGILIKDNHLAYLAEQHQLDREQAVGKGVELAKQYCLHNQECSRLVVEVEVDTLGQLEVALQSSADVVLLDNMGPPILREAVSRRDQLNPKIVLEASGGINLDTVSEIAQTGVDRISVGSLTHSAPNADIGLDWQV